MSNPPTKRRGRPTTSSEEMTAVVVANSSSISDTGDQTKMKRARATSSEETTVVVVNSSSDFKTDHISSGQVQQRAALYLPQLKWYCKAAGEILDVKNVSGWLYFLAPAAAVQVYPSLGSI